MNEAIIVFGTLSVLITGVYFILKRVRNEVKEEVYDIYTEIGL